VFKSIRYRAAFDGVVGEVLNEVGFSTNAEKLAFWPAGKSRELIIAGKAQGIEPERAACEGIEEYVRQNSSIPQELKTAIFEAVMLVRVRQVMRNP
jgi:hypothetical protein